MGRMFFSILLFSILLPSCKSDKKIASPEMIITIDTVTFVPETARVYINTTVTWLNQDQFSHDVISGKTNKKDGLFASEFIEPGHKWSHLFDSAGTYSYFCSIHPWKMHGVVIVNKKQ